MVQENGLTFKVAYDYWNSVTNMPFPNGWAKFLREEFIKNGGPTDSSHYSSTHSEMYNKFKNRKEGENGFIHVLTERYNPNETYFYLLEGVGCDHRNFIDLKHHNHYSTYLGENISPIALEMAQKGNLYIVVNYSHEPIGDDSLFIAIADFCKTYNIPEKNIIYFTGAMNVYDLCNKTLSKHDFNVYTDNVVMSTSGDSLRILIDGGRHDVLGYETTLITEDEINTPEREKYFICLNRNSHKPHRMGLGMFIEHEKMWDKFYISYLEDLNKRNNHFDLIVRKDEEFRQNMLHAYKPFMDKTPMQLDTHILNEHERMCFSVVRAYRKDLYLNSYIYIVTETKFDTFVYPSEKICNPMIVLQPFIVFAAPHFLKHIRSLGFKTFSPFIDESYDDEEDNEKRFILLCNLIKKLSKLDKKEIHDWYVSIKDILIHNRNLLYKMSFNNNFENRFIEILEHERNNNINYRKPWVSRDAFG
jgi:hypothetical protein